MCVACRTGAASVLLLGGAAAAVAGEGHHAVRGEIDEMLVEDRRVQRVEHGGEALQTIPQLRARGGEEAWHQPIVA